MAGLAVVSLKGGVGKTTVVLGLAGAARARGLRVLVVDLDPQANATAGLNPGKVKFTSGDVLADGREGVAADAVIPSGWGGVDLIASEPALEHRNSSQTAGSALRLRRALRPVAQEYDVVLMDCPPSLGEVTRNGLAAAMQALVVTEPSFFALLGAEQALEAVGVVRDSANLRLRVAGIIVNRMRRTLAEHAYRWNEVAQAYPQLLLTPAVPERAVIQRAQGAGVAVQDLDHRGGGEVTGVFESLLGQTLDRTGSRRPQGV
ncbi:MAG: ParA family protein [Candidatus Nanopelagicales bacterium]|nr:ParA family protein [Candidatus Nanopelagicales bacterium]